MSATYPFSLRIFVADGDPDGLRIVDRSNWTGKALMFPRAIFPSIKNRPEFSQTGVYLLLSSRDENDEAQIYIGEGDPIKSRLEDHYLNKDFWSIAVFFISTGTTPLNKAHVQFLESRLITLAGEAKRMSLENKKQETEPTLSEADKAEMTVFLEHLLGMTPVLGINAFEQPKPRKSDRTQSNVLYVDAKGIKASGYESTQGMTVLKGSAAILKENPSAEKYAHGVVELRSKLIERGVLIPNENGTSLIFVQDYSFTSPSSASGVILGGATNGRMDWKDKQGRTLKAIQEAASKS